MTEIVKTNTPFVRSELAATQRWPNSAARGRSTRPSSSRPSRTRPFDLSPGGLHRPLPRPARDLHRKIKAFKLLSSPAPTGAGREEPHAPAHLRHELPEKAALEAYLHRLEERRSATTARSAGSWTSSPSPTRSGRDGALAPNGRSCATSSRSSSGASTSSAATRWSSGRASCARSSGGARALRQLRENMYFTEIDEQRYGIKPMNCLAHMMIYKSQLRSYRDLPLRYFELAP